MMHSCNLCCKLPWRLASLRSTERTKQRFCFLQIATPSIVDTRTMSNFISSLFNDFSRAKKLIQCLNFHQPGSFRGIKGFFIKNIFLPIEMMQLQTIKDALSFRNVLIYCVNFWWFINSMAVKLIQMFLWLTVQVSAIDQVILHRNTICNHKYIYWNIYWKPKFKYQHVGSTFKIIFV